MAARAEPACIDCQAEGVTTVRKIHPDSGPRSPRCATHLRARKRAARKRAHERHVQTTYGLSDGDYDRLYRAQGGLCFICGPITGNAGKSKRLPVDHDHRCCPGPVSCGECVRGLLCSLCNRYLGHLRDNPQALLRAALYLVDPPARRVLHHDLRIPEKG